VIHKNLLDNIYENLLSMLKFIVALIILAFLIITIYAILMPKPGYCPLYTGSACKSNLKQIEVSLEVYKVNNNGKYPDSIAQAFPNPYNRAIRLCPSSGRWTGIPIEPYCYLYGEWKERKDTYSMNYRVNDDHDTFTVFCSAVHYRGFYRYPRNYPQFDSIQGLIEK